MVRGWVDDLTAAAIAVPPLLGQFALHVCETTARMEDACGDGEGAHAVEATAALAVVLLCLRRWLLLALDLKSSCR